MNALLLTFLFIGAAFGAATYENIPKAEGPACPLPAVIEVPASSLNLTLGSENDIIIHISTASRQEGGVATGLQDLSYTYNIGLDGLAVKVDFTATIPGQVCIDGDSYTADGSLNFSPFTALPTGEFAGTGSFHACITDARIVGHARASANIITGKLTVKEVVLSVVTFAGVDVDLVGMALNGEVVDWATWSAELKDKFDAELPIHGEGFCARVAQAATWLLRHLTLQDIIDMIGTTKPPSTCAPVL